MWPSGPIFRWSRTLFTSFLFTWRILHVFVLVLQPQAAKSCLKPLYMKCFSHKSIYWLSISSTFELKIQTLKMVFVITFPVTWVVHNHRNYVALNKSSNVRFKWYPLLAYYIYTSAKTHTLISIIISLMYQRILIYYAR